MITLTEVAAVMGFLAFLALVLYGLGSLRDAHDHLLEAERKRKFCQRLEEQELSKAKEAWNRGDIKDYEFHRSCYSSLVTQGKEDQMKGK